MKRVVICLLALGGTLCALASPLYYWGSDGGLDQTAHDVFDMAGNLVPQGSMWLVEMVDVNDGSIILSLNNVFQDGDGWFYADAQDANGLNGKTVKSVIYNSDSKASATAFAVFSKQYTFSWGSPPPPSITDYYAGVVNSSDWQAVPEPAVAGLIAIFGTGSIFARRIFRRAS